MISWPFVVIPAVVTALVVNLDARFIGPYFSLSSLIMATEGPEARFMYGDPTRRAALIRRFLYPVIMGIALSWFVSSAVGVGAAGGLAAGLLIWPVIFHGFPVGISRRSWEVPVLYLSFSISFIVLSILGLKLKSLLTAFSNGHELRWIEGQALSSFLFWMGAMILTGIYRSMFRRVAAKTE